MQGALQRDEAGLKGWVGQLGDSAITAQAAQQFAPNSQARSMHTAVLGTNNAVFVTDKPGHLFLLRKHRALRWHELATASETVPATSLLGCVERPKRRTNLACCERGRPESELISRS